MRTSVVLSLAVAGLLGAAAPGLAGQTHISDSQYLVAARCAGLAEGLGDDTKPYDRTLDVEGANRANFVMDAADTARGDGVRLARRRDAKAKAEVAVEIEGVCTAYR